MSKAKRKQVLVEVSGGVAEAVLVPPGINIEIWDWDNYNEADYEEQRAMWEALDAAFQRRLKRVNPKKVPPREETA